MVAAIAITRKDYTTEQLRDCAKRTKNADAAHRMLVLALVLEGKSRTEAATSRGMVLFGLPRARVALRLLEWLSQTGVAQK